MLAGALMAGRPRAHLGLRSHRGGTTDRTAQVGALAAARAGSAVATGVTAGMMRLGLRGRFPARTATGHSRSHTTTTIEPRHTGVVVVPAGSLTRPPSTPTATAVTAQEQTARFRSCSGVGGARLATGTASGGVAEPGETGGRARVVAPPRPPRLGTPLLPHSSGYTEHVSVGWQVSYIVSGSRAGGGPYCTGDRASDSHRCSFSPHGFSSLRGLGTTSQQGGSSSGGDGSSDSITTTSSGRSNSNSGSGMSNDSTNNSRVRNRDSDRSHTHGRSNHHNRHNHNYNGETARPFRQPRQVPQHTQRQRGSHQQHGRSQQQGPDNSHGRSREDELRNHLRCGRLEAAAAAVVRLKGPPLLAGTYNALFGSLGKAGLKKELGEVYGQFLREGVRGWPPDVRLLSAAVAAFCRVGAPDVATKIIKSDMPRLGVEPTTFSFNPLISGYARLGRLGDAESVLASMTAAGVEPDAVSYASLVNAYGKAGRVDAASRTVAEMKNRGLTPSPFAYNALIQAHGSSGSRDEAIQVMRDMANARLAPTVVSFNALVTGLCRAGHRQTALEVIKNDMEEFGVKPDVITFTAVVSAAGRDGDIRGVVAAIDAMESVGVTPNAVTFTSLIKSFASESGSEHARLLAERMAAYGLAPTVETVGALAHAYAVAREPERAAAVVADAARRFGLAPSVVTIGALVDGYGRVGRPAAAEAELAQYIARGGRPNAAVFGALANAYAKVGDVEGVRKVIGDMGGYGVKPNVVAYTALVDAHAVRGDYRGAAGTLSEMVAAGVQPNVVTYNVVMEAHVRGGNCAGAASVFDNIRRAGLQPDTASYTTLIEALSRGGDGEGVLRAIRELKAAAATGVEPNIVTYNNIFDAAGFMGDLSLLEDQFAAMLAAARRPGLEINANALTSVVEAYGRNGFIGSAAGVVDGMLEGAYGSHCVPNTKTARTLLSFASTPAVLPECGRELYGRLKRADETRPLTETERESLAQCVAVLKSKGRMWQQEASTPVV